MGKGGLGTLPTTMRVSVFISNPAHRRDREGPRRRGACVRPVGDRWGPRGDQGPAWRSPGVGPVGGGGWGSPHLSSSCKLGRFWRQGLCLTDHSGSRIFSQFLCAFCRHVSLLVPPIFLLLTSLHICRRGGPVNSKKKCAGSQLAVRLRGSRP